MCKMKFLFLLVLLCITVTTAQSNALSLSLEATFVSGSTEQIEISVNFDFTDVPMLGGGFDIHYDANVYTFISSEYPYCFNLSDPRCGPASPPGSLVEPGLFEGVGIGTFEFFTGINTAGLMRTFTFDSMVLPAFGDSLCIEGFCLMPNVTNPWYSIAGEDVTHIIFNQVPIPGAVWLLLSGLGCLTGFRKRVDPRI